MTTMKGYAATLAPPRVLAMFREVQQHMRRVPTKTDAGAWVACHSIARAMRSLIAPRAKLTRTVRVVDGYFMHLGWEHSWIEIDTVPSDHPKSAPVLKHQVYSFKRGKWGLRPGVIREVFHAQTWIIDAYPVAQVGGPMLLHARGSFVNSPWSSAYLPRPLKRATSVEITKQTKWLLKHFAASARLRE